MRNQETTAMLLSKLSEREGFRISTDDRHVIFEANGQSFYAFKGFPMEEMVLEAYLFLTAHSMAKDLAK